jgi:hypothetical protein
VTRCAPRSSRPECATKSSHGTHLEFHEAVGAFVLELRRSAFLQRVIPETRSDLLSV